MSEQPQYPPTQATDRDGEFINFTEEFRRAKRNSLTWSAIVTFVAYAPKWSPDAQILGFKVAYTQGALTALLFIVASFFLIEYVRSLSRVIPLNNEASQNQAKRWISIEAMLEGWQGRLMTRQNELNHLYRRGRDLRERGTEAEKWFDDLPQQLAARKRSMVDYPWEEWRTQRHSPSMEVDPPENQLKRLQDAFDAYRDRVAKFDEATQEDLANRFAQYEAAIRKIEAEETLVRDQIGALSDRIGAFTKELSTFRGAILDREKNWHMTLDRLAIFGAFFFALLGTIMRIGQPTYLDGAITAIFG